MSLVNVCGSNVRDYTSVIDEHIPLQCLDRLITVAFVALFYIRLLRGAQERCMQNEDGKSDAVSCLACSSGVTSKRYYVAHRPLLYVRSCCAILDVE